MSLSKIEQKLIDAIAEAEKEIDATHDVEIKKKAIARRNMAIVALEIKDPAHIQIEENYKIYASLVQDAEKLKSEILQMIAEYKAKRGFFLPLGFDYNSGHTKLDIEKAQEVGFRHGFELAYKQRISQVVDEKATIIRIQNNGLEVPWKATAASIFEKKKHTKDEHDEVEI